MQAHPMIAGLRSAPAPQPCTDSALAAWRAAPQVVAITAALSRFGAGEPLSGLADLARVVQDHGAASALADGLIAPMIAASRHEPLAQIPLGHSAAPGFARLRLANSGRAALTLAAFARRPAAVSASALFEDCEALEIVIAGTARARLHRLEEGQLCSEDLACAPGIRLTRRGPDDARQIVEVTHPLLVLQLSREATRPAPSREIALGDGALLKTISGCKRASQRMMALGVLGALGARTAMGQIECLALDREAEPDLRWEALRQLLAMDAARGLAVLAELADGPAGTLTAPAAALLRDLRESRPDLAELIREFA